MKKVFVIVMLIGVSVVACNSNTSKSTTSDSVAPATETPQEIVEKPAPITDSVATAVAAAQAAKTEDSLRQVKEHGHAH